jgi:hypothetical protein
MIPVQPCHQKSAFRFVTAHSSTGLSHTEKLIAAFNAKALSDPDSGPVPSMPVPRQGPPSPAHRPSPHSPRRPRNSRQARPPPRPAAAGPPAAADRGQRTHRSRTTHRGSRPRTTSPHGLAGARRVHKSAHCAARLRLAVPREARPARGAPCRVQTIQQPPRAAVRPGPEAAWGSAGPHTDSDVRINSAARPARRGPRGIPSSTAS